ncbi:hypothetical protein FEM21_03110 [Flavobacterium seoulense]|uniref:Uncharacterized protein n=1 Tax=Flavobacterium seoulense TaxID=1492738 RepID=A0A066WW54_9FLAO|nr:hypothetical protein FEM21_03110 [Flavobacterium seoulense]
MQIYKVFQFTQTFFKVFFENFKKIKNQPQNQAFKKANCFLENFVNAYNLK